MTAVLRRAAATRKWTICVGRLMAESLCTACLRPSPERDRTSPRRLQLGDAQLPRHVCEAVQQAILWRSRRVRHMVRGPRGPGRNSAGRVRACRQDRVAGCAADPSSACHRSDPPLLADYALPCHARLPPQSTLSVNQCTRQAMYTPLDPLKHELRSYSLRINAALCSGHLRWWPGLHLSVTLPVAARGARPTGLDAWLAGCKCPRRFEAILRSGRIGTSS